MKCVLTQQQSFCRDKLNVNVYGDRDTMGKAAASDVAEAIRACLSGKEEVNMIFAAAPSQNELLKYLAADERIPWGRINAFHLDEYIGLPAGAPQLFSAFLEERLFSQRPFKSVHLMDGGASNPAEECERYTALLKR